MLTAGWRRPDGSRGPGARRSAGLPLRSPSISVESGGPACPQLPGPLTIYLTPSHRPSGRPTCSSTSPGVPSPHDRCLQILKASFEMSAPSVPTPLHIHCTSESKGLDTLSFTLAPFTRDNLVENVATDPALNFLSSCRRSLLERSPRIVRTGEAHFPVEQTSQNTSTWVDFSKRKKSVCAPTLSKAILLNGTSS